MKVKVPVYEMLIDESDESDLMVDFIALVDKPAIQKDFMKFGEEFINPSKGEHKTEFLPRCISYVINEGKETVLVVVLSLYCLVLNQIEQWHCLLEVFGPLLRL